MTMFSMQQENPQTNGVVVARGVAEDSVYRRKGRPIWLGTDGEVYLYDAKGDAAKPWRSCRYGVGRKTDEEAAAIYNSRGVSTNVYEKLSDSTLWAKWKANTYTLTLDGGSFTGKVSVTYGTCPAPVRVPFREGYEFRGYVNGENVMIYGADGKSTLASYETAANQDLTALWGRLLLEVGYIAICWLFLHFLYRHKVFLKV